MGSKHILLSCALLALAGGSACAVNRPGDNAARCTVQGGELLPPSSGGGEALCAEIEAAIAQSATPATVSVRVVAPHLLAATVTVGGRDLPEIKMSRSDAALDRLAFRRFAKAIVAAAANPPRP